MFSKKKSLKMIKTGILQNGTVQFQLYQNFPNPFVKRTVFKLDIPRSCEIKLVVFSKHEEEPVIVYNGLVEEGIYSIEWNGRNNMGEKLKAGSYVYQLQSAGFVASRKLKIKDNFFLRINE